MILGGERCTVIVQNRKRVKDDYNGTDLVNDGEPVVLPCSVQIVDATEVESLGLQKSTLYRVICRSWPGNIDSIVYWDGDTWEQVGDTRHYRNGYLTQHDDALLRKIPTSAERMKALAEAIRPPMDQDEEVPNG